MSTSGGQTPSEVALMVAALGALASSVSAAVALWRSSTDARSKRSQEQSLAAIEASLVFVTYCDGVLSISNKSSRAAFAVAGVVSLKQTNEDCLASAVRIDPGMSVPFIAAPRDLEVTQLGETWTWTLEFEDAAGERWTSRESGVVRR